MGAVKQMLAFSRWPAERRTPLIERCPRRKYPSMQESTGQLQ
jgi:hypothetical protein